MKRLALTAVATALVALAAPAEAADSCTTIHGTGHGFLTGPASTAGTIDTDGDGDADGTFVSFITGVPKDTSSSGVLLLPSSHVISLDDGTTLTTSDHLQAVPTDETGVFRLVSNLDVVSGGSGHLVAQGTLNFVTGEITLESWMGAICS